MNFAVMKVTQDILHEIDCFAWQRFVKGARKGKEGSHALLIKAHHFQAHSTILFYESSTSTWLQSVSRNAVKKAFHTPLNSLPYNPLQPVHLLLHSAWCPIILNRCNIGFMQSAIKLELLFRNFKLTSGPLSAIFDCMFGWNCGCNKV